MSLVHLGIYVQFTIYNNVRTYISRYPIVYTSIHVVSDCRCVLGALSRGGNCVVLWWIRVICISPWLQAQKWIGISGWGHRLFYAQTELIPSKGNFLSWLGTKSDAQNSLWLKRNNGLINRALKYAFQPRQHKIAQFQMVLVFSFLEKVLPQHHELECTVYIYCQKLVTKTIFPVYLVLKPNVAKLKGQCHEIFNHFLLY